MNNFGIGNNTFVAESARIGNNVHIGHNCIIEDRVFIGDDTFIDSNTIIRQGVSIGRGGFIGSNCIIGEYLMDFCKDRQYHSHPLSIGVNVLIRSGSIIYAGSTIGDHFQTGHQTTIREKANIGNNVSIGTLSDIQCSCKIGNYVRLHSNVFIAPLSVIDDFVWLFPHVILTNDPTPPSSNFVGVHIHSFAIVASGAIVMPGLDLGQDCLIGAGAIVTKSVEPYTVVVGNPAKSISDVRKIKNKVTGKLVYPWREYFCNYMPWEGIGFEAWFNSLDLNEKQKFTISDINI
ncbi:N-acetyltransferase [Succinimonas amylolytica]|uniref:N-acetyltransferase n=1 Tax=Succinimonas amylolytica TaxID=83769 RepID=UPI00035CE255|nr:N-acetyltransferase [Succinimonas amylolytica]